MIRLVHLKVACIIFIASNMTTTAQSPAPPVPPEWQTHAEKTDYRETPNYEDTVAYCRKLDAASANVRYTDFGQSGEGRALPLVVAANGEAFTPQAVRRAGKAVVLVQANIHAGETDGKDAGLALLRDAVMTKTRPGLLDRVTLLFIPIYNVDGHERRSPFNRINQNGPAEVGWRANASNLNLNRDYMKADAPETRAWLRLWNEWQPDLFIDCHVTDGADFRYNVTYQYEARENVPQPLRDWAKAAFDGRIVPAAEAAGNLLSPYLVFRDNRDPAGKGVQAFISTPRFATGYVPLRNRPALLIETHMIKDYRTRVRGTYDLLKAALEDVNRDPEGWLKAGRATDEQVSAEGTSYDPARKVALSVSFTDTSVPLKLKAVEFRREVSEISGAVRVVYGDKPLDLTVPFFNESRTTIAVTPPLYYLVPPQWSAVIDVLAAHGLRLQKLAEPLSLEVESYRFGDVKWAANSFEGRLPLTQKNQLVREQRSYPTGTVVVPLAQPGGRVALHLLEPDAPDSLVSWGFFNPIFEQKEGAEDYVLEKLAREMLAKDAGLRKEFEQRLLNDPQFAANARERLRFFYTRSTYWDRRLNLYPVGRVTSKLDVRVTDFPAGK
ncbi:MAG: M14 family metallopeptidase [Pyrinomonadaceae bacterium]